MTTKQLQPVRNITYPPLTKVGIVATLLDASPRKVRDMCAKGEIKAVKIGSDWRVNTVALAEQFGIDITVGA